MFTWYYFFTCACCESWNPNNSWLVRGLVNEAPPVDKIRLSSEGVVNVRVCFCFDFEKEVNKVSFSIGGREKVFKMPSADMRSITSANTNGNVNPLPLRGPEFNISSKDVEGLVSEIKQNLRLSASTLKAVPCNHISRKSSRASPYFVPGRISCSCDSTSCEINRKNKRKTQKDSSQDDPYEFLQKLLRDGSLVNEAVRRVQLGLSPKQRYFYESDEEIMSPILFCSQEN